jgi:cyclohexadieny/prephenate dehydrogenase
MSETLTIALLGAGQLGGSFVLGLREAGADIHVRAYDPSPTHAEELKARGGVDIICTSPAETVKGADIVLLASPLRTYRTLASAIAHTLEDGCIVADLGSVKGTMAAISHLLPKAHLVPAHPIAGSEKSGPSAARGDLFSGKLCILTPDESTEENAFRAVEALWEMVGADVIAMPAEVHDQIYAHVSHLPHYIAFVSASYFHTLGIRLKTEDTNLQQFLRISRSNPRMWTDVALENREALLPALGAYIALLEHFASELRAGEPTSGGDSQAIAKALLPRILAASLISSVSLYEKQSSTNLRPFGGAGMRDIVAPAAVTPEADTESISHHATQMAELIEGIIPYFRTVESLIGAEDEPALYAAISQMAEDAHALVVARN